MKYEYWPPEGEDQPEHPNPSLVFIPFDFEKPRPKPKRVLAKLPGLERSIRKVVVCKGCPTCGNRLN